MSKLIGVRLFGRWIELVKKLCSNMSCLLMPTDPVLTWIRYLESLI